MPSTMAEIAGQPAAIRTAITTLAMPEINMPTQPGCGPISNAKEISNTPWSTKTTPTTSVSATAPASGLKSRNTPAAMEIRLNRSAPKNGPVPCIENEPKKVNPPEIKNTQPTRSVATSVETIGKTMAAIPNITIAKPSQNSLPEDS